MEVRFVSLLFMNDTGQLLPDNGVDAMTTVSSDRIRIKLKAYDYRILDKAVAEIVDTARAWQGQFLCPPISINSP